MDNQSVANKNRYLIAEPAKNLQSQPQHTHLIEMGVGLKGRERRAQALVRRPQDSVRKRELDLVVLRHAQRH